MIQQKKTRSGISSMPYRNLLASTFGAACALSAVVACSTAELQPGDANVVEPVMPVPDTAEATAAPEQSSSDLAAPSRNEDPAPSGNEDPAPSRNEPAAAPSDEGPESAPGPVEPPTAPQAGNQPQVPNDNDGDPVGGSAGNNGGEPTPQPPVNPAATPPTGVGPAPAADLCAAQGFTRSAFKPGEAAKWGGVAGDFSVNTRRGVWTLSEEWTGCDNYVFIVNHGDAVGVSLVNTLGPGLFTRSAPNTHYFFFTDGGAAPAGSAQWELQAARAIAALPEADREHWIDRVHFVTDAPLGTQGSLRSLFSATDPARGFAIDRAQTWDNLGSSSIFNGAFVTDVSVFGYSSRYYNFRFAQTERLEAEQGVTEVSLMDNVVFSPEKQGNNGPFSNSNQGSIWPARFPNRATMTKFDAMELVITGECGPHPGEDCGAWDYEAFLQLCSDAQCSDVVGEVARWIAPYSRPGKRSWVFKLTPLLGLLHDGGTQHFRFRMVWNMNPSTWNMTFRLRDTGADATVSQTTPAWSGNRSFDPEYNDGYSPIRFTPPASTKKVELVAVISGHGQDTGSCAEWCEHQHEFTVNRNPPHLREFPGQVSTDFCANQVDQGVIPGQYGNWTRGRAGWCPGLPVQPWVLDITDEVNMGQQNTLSYRGLLRGSPLNDNQKRGRVRFQTYITYSE